jgi:hypothetical protein
MGYFHAEGDCVSRSRGGANVRGETNAQQREANERIAAVWESLARLRENQRKEGTASGSNESGVQALSRVAKLGLVSCGSQ